MALAFDADILADTVGLQLCKMVGTRLRLADPVAFANGRSAVLSTLNRAVVCGHVGGGIDGDTEFWADQLDENGDSIGEIRLDRGSWNALKNRWMKSAMVADA